MKEAVDKKKVKSTSVVTAGKQAPIPGALSGEDGTWGDNSRHTKGIQKLTFQQEFGKAVAPLFREGAEFGVGAVCLSAFCSGAVSYRTRHEMIRF